MSFQITTSFIKDFRGVITLRSQQVESRIRGRVRVESGIRGTEASFDHVGKRRPTKRQSRHADTKLTDTPHERRWVGLFVYDDADLIDQPDLIRSLNDPTNVYTQSMAAGFGRLYDEVIFDQMDVSVRSGVDGTGTATLNAAHSIVESGTDGWTIAKILQAKKLLDAAEQPMDRHAAGTAQQFDDLLKIAAIQTIDINTVKALAMGAIDTFAGFSFVRVEDPILKTGSAGTMRKTYWWSRNNMLLAIGRDIQASIDRRPDKNNSWQIFYSVDFGALRMDDKGLVMQEAYEAP